MDSFSFFPQLKYLTILPSQGSKLSTQLIDCYDQLKENTGIFSFNSEDFIKQTIFVKASNNKDFYDIKNTINSVINSVFNYSIPTTVVAQTPGNKALVTLEVVILRQSANYSVINKSYSGFDYTIIQSQHSKMIISGGLSFDIESTDISLQSHKSFDIMNGILQAEGCDFSDVIRQWNYIENITGFTENGKCKGQHYQIFNNIRSRFYKDSNFIHGYPASTGIGTYSGGVVIDFFAMKGKENLKIYPVKNPAQTDAYNYTQDVLFSDDKLPKHDKNTPKFERALLITENNSATLFVSGTAAIKGEHTIPDSDAGIQTRITLENIGILSGNQNLGSHGLLLPYKKKKISLLRVYVKEESDIPSVEKIIAETHGNCPCLVIQSDICRSNLKVEIEGVIEFEY